MHESGRKFVAGLRGREDDANDVRFWVFLGDLRDTIHRALMRKVWRGELSEEMADVWTFTHLLCSGFSIEEISEADPVCVEAWRREWIRTVH